MYNEQLEAQTLKIDVLFLDPNNPRFWPERSARVVPDEKITDEVSQSRSMDRLERDFNIEDLRFSILRNGFLKLDRIVVRKLNIDTEAYVAVEGNRRLAALKSLRQQIEDGLIDEDHVDDDYLDRLYQNTNEIEVLLYQGADVHDISWMLQGIRHVSGIKEWEPAQRARLVAEQIDDHDMTFTEAGQKFGYSAKRAGRDYRTYKALQQMFNDDEYGKKARNDYFSLFEKAVSKPTLKRWMEWDEDNFRFGNFDNLHQFYDWIIPDEDFNNTRRIDDPKEVDILARLIDGNYQNLITQVDQHEVDIEEASRIAQSGPSEYDWERAMESARGLLSGIPTDAVQANPQRFIEKLDEIGHTISKLKKMAEALLDG